MILYWLFFPKKQSFNHFIHSCSKPGLVPEFGLQKTYPCLALNSQQPCTLYYLKTVLNRVDSVPSIGLDPGINMESFHVPPTGFEHRLQQYDLILNTLYNRMLFGKVGFNVRATFRRVYSVSLVLDFKYNLKPTLANVTK